MSIWNYANPQLRDLVAYEPGKPIEDVARELLRMAMHELNLSARAHDRILKVARTIADLEAAPAIGAQHLSEAIQYRSLDRNLWV